MWSCVITNHWQSLWVTRHTSLHFRGRETSPVPTNSQSTSSSRLQPLCLVVVVAMGAVVTATATEERDGPHISSPNHKQPPEDGGDEQIVHYLLSRTCRADELLTTLRLSMILASIQGSIIVLHNNWEEILGNGISNIGKWKFTILQNGMVSHTSKDSILSLECLAYWSRLLEGTS